MTRGLLAAPNLTRCSICEKGPIFATKFSESGRWLLTASLDGTACVWDVNERKLFMQFRCHAGESARANRGCAL